MFEMLFTSIKTSNMNTDFIMVMQEVNACLLNKLSKC